ncbi:hypothetical protein [Polaribacter sp. HL-MS24]|uniref:hypothetical protein n=1 Tax=Polaribacter sp. HL-MS24 TaxID=3077735 RepID=UPI00293447AE|nr:hypothetical protein [Polaribacter sp. HL-MS24]WOC41061.1 hypothetical protein RRF69_04695 [Polaribacter sp. HL-MS24]
MAMDNRWNMSMDPTGGCTDADGNACVRPEFGSTVLDGGGNSWSHDGESWNLETPMVTYKPYIEIRIQKISMVYSPIQWIP